MSLRNSRNVESLERRVLFATLPANFSEDLLGGTIENGTAMAFAPDGRLFVTEQGGQLRVIDHGVLQATPFVTVPTSANGERGLLGIAFDPDYFDNHYVYVYYTAATPSTHNRVSRFTADPANQNLAVPGSEAVLLDLNNLSGATNHNGGAIHFGPDGKLYIAVGENASGGNAQTFSNLLGKMLRMDKEGAIPTDNPYFNDPNVLGQNKLIWSLGLRNPYTFAFQPGTGRMFINDVGQETWEEINDGIAHSNYGWPATEGKLADDTSPPNPAIVDYRDPIYVYDHGNSQTAIIGGAFYNPVYSSYPATYNGKYFFADLGAGWIHTLDFSGAPIVANFASGASFISGMALSPDGSVTYVQRGGPEGAYRIRYADAVAPTVSSPTLVYDETKPAFGTSQRVRLSFSEYVGDSLTNAQVTLKNETTNQTVSSANISLQYDAATNVATFSFPGYADANGVLPNGLYHLTLAPGSVSDVTGNALANGIDTTFFVLAGDADHSGTVDLTDLVRLSTNWQGSGKTFSQADFNYDGKVNLSDLVILANNWQKNNTTFAASSNAASMPTLSAVQTPARPPVRKPTRPIDVIA